MDVTSIAENAVAQDDDEEPALESKKDKKIINLFQRLPNLNIFTLHKLIGEGSYSSVYLASLRCDSHVSDNHKKFFAIKHLIPIVHPDRIEQELWCLKYIGGCDNVVGVHLCLRHYNTVVFVMPYIPHTKFSNYFMLMDLMEIKLYMKNLLIAIRRVHKFNVIHRDVKPSNFLYDRDNRRYLLVDFGLAQKICYRNDLDVNNTQKISNVINKNQTNRIEPTTSAVKRKHIELNDNDEHVQSKKPRQLNKLLELMRNNTRLQMMLDNQTNINNLNNRNVSMNKQRAPQTNYTIQPTITRNNNNVNKGCLCNGEPRVCENCLNKLPYKASRSGTQGFRPPEVLLKYTEQTTAVDIWACGVIFLSLLSGSYPFFRGSDDMTALAEFITVFGSARMKRVAKLLGRELLCNYDKKAFDLKKLCLYLRTRSFKSAARDLEAEELKIKKKMSSRVKISPKVKETEHEYSTNYNRNGIQDAKHNFSNLVNNDSNVSENQYCDNCALIYKSCVCFANDDVEIKKKNAHGHFKNPCELPDEAFDLLERLLDINPHTRITAADALQHPFLANI